MARPKALTKALKDEICRRIVDGETVRQICADRLMPDPRTVYRTLAREDEREFCHQYALARAIQLQDMLDELLEIADDTSNDWIAKHNEAGDVISWQVNNDQIERSRLMIDTRKWVISKLAPKKYGG